MPQIIQDLTLLLLVSLPINVFFHRIRLPSIMGFLIAGILIGPHCLGWIGDPSSVENLAEIGIILLLFIIGLEFSISHLFKNMVSIISAGVLQMGLTIAAWYFLHKNFFGGPDPVILALAMMVALSSTAIVFKMVTDRAELDTLHGRTTIGILLFQDLCVVPLMLMIPLLAHSGQTSGTDFALAFAKALAAVAGIFFLSRLLVPRFLSAVARMGSKEHLTLLVILIILGSGWVSHQLGLSLAMGAFIAGLIISESEYSHQIILDILPLRDYFSSIFFISIGMLLNIGNFLDHFSLILGITLILVVMKVVSGFLASVAVGNSARISFIVGVRLAQVGEFSLILAGLALTQGLLSSDHHQTFLTVAVLTMLIAPLLIQVSSPASHILFSRWTPGEAPEESTQPAGQTLKGHVIIAGYDVVGRNLARVLKETHVPFMVVEMDGELIKHALTEDVPILYGDVSHRATLDRVGIAQAKIIVYSIPDHKATEQSVRLARQLNPEVFIMVRTRFSSQVDELKKAGADQVIPEEFETSIEIFSRVLREFRMPNNIIEQQVELVRLEGYGMFRGLSLNVESLRNFSTYLTASLSQSYQVTDECWSHGRQFDHRELTRQTGATLIAVVRDNHAQPNPPADFCIRTGDVLIVFGRHAQVDKAMRLLRSGPDNDTASSPAS
ncbi:MAG: potassium transporter Kef [Nitrospina sp.]|nr:MAG: potassium transporter Kef [Nitrospina sp.]TDJ59856.1 MAG: potassium transporter Kef [Nitrospina sp.]